MLAKTLVAASAANKLGAARRLILLGKSAGVSSAIEKSALTGSLSLVFSRSKTSLSSAILPSSRKTKHQNNQVGSHLAEAASPASLRGLVSLCDKIKSSDRISRGFLSALSVASVAAAGAAAASYKSPNPLGVIGSAHCLSTASHSTAVSVDSSAASYRPPELDVVLYQYEVCPYCNKVRAYLDYRRIPYTTVEVNPMSKQELKFSEYKKVPVIVVNGEQYNSSSDIIVKIENMICASLRDGRKQSLSSENLNDAYVLTEEEEKWFQWVDNRLIKILPPNIYRTVRESFQTFEYLTPLTNFTWYQKEASRWFGSTVMYFVAKKLKKKHDIDDPRQALYDEVNAFADAVGPNQQFMGGDLPNLADISVFGVLRAIEPYDTFKDMMENSNIGPWYYRMKEKVGKSSRLNQPLAV